MKFISFALLISFSGFYYAQKSFYYLQNSQFHQIDTISLEDAENFGLEDFVLNLGNHGSPEFRLMPELNDLITNDYSNLTYLRDHNFRRYKVFTPIVDAKYVIGTGQEQHFNFLHSQNINEKVNYSIGLDKINSKGIYQNQATNFTDIFLNIYGEELAKKRYDFDLQFNYINAAASLNGGLEDDSTFINDTLDLQNRELLGVNLVNAYQELEKWHGQFSQAYAIFNRLDSNENGTRIKVSNYIQYQHSSRHFYDSILNIDFYDRILNDSSVTDETMTYQTLKGYLGLDYGYRPSSSAMFSMNFGTEVSQNWYRQMELDTSRLDIGLRASANYAKSYFSFGGKVDYLINDSYENKDYNVRLFSRYFLGKFWINAEAYLSNERPQLDLLRYSGNHVSWNNSFEKYQIKQFNVGAVYHGKWDVEAVLNYTDVHQPIYFGYDKTPYQALGVAQIIRTSISAKNKENERWDLSGEVHYQYQGGYNVFRLPSFLAKIGSAYKFKAFKKKMCAAVGADITYFSSYETKHFDPVTGQFYIYSNGSIGNYPYVNLFVKSRVQRATFFLMMSHPHQGLLGNRYFYFPGYPANDRFFRIGISWLFVN